MEPDGVAAVDASSFRFRGQNASLEMHLDPLVDVVVAVLVPMDGHVDYRMGDGHVRVCVGEPRLTVPQDDDELITAEAINIVAPVMALKAASERYQDKVP